MKNAAPKAKPASAYGSSRAKSIGIWNQLVEPAASIREPERRRRVRLLSALLATLSLLGFLSIILTLFTKYQPSDLYINAGTTLLLAVTYYLSRTRQYNLAALLMVSTICGTIFAAEILNPEPSTLNLLVIGVLVSSLFLSRRDTALIMAAILIGIGLVWVSFPAMPGRDVAITMFAVLSVGVLGIVTVTIRQQDLGQIEAQARRLVEDAAKRERAEEAVQRSEKRFRALIENSADAITLLDANGIAVYDSPSAAGMLGYGPEDWIGQNVFQLMHADDLQKIQALFQDLGKTPGARINSTFRLRHKNGFWLWIEAVATNLLADPGVQAVVINYRDINERKQSEQALSESEENYRTLVEKMSEGVIVVDNDDIIQFVNNSFTHLAGYSREELLGKVAYNLFIHEEDRELLKEKNDLRLEQKSDDYEVRLKTKSGETIWLQVSGTPLLDAQGNVIGSIGINTDITERKHSQEELQRRLADFEAVNLLSAGMRQARTLDELLPIILDVTLSVLHLTSGGIWLYDSVRDELRLAITRGYAALPPPEKPGEGVAGYVFATKQPFIEPDFHLSPRLPEAVRQMIPPGIGGASIPMRAGDKVIGTLNVSVPQPRELTPNEIHLLATLSEIAGNAIQRSTLHQQTEQRLQHLAALGEIDRAIMTSFDLNFSLNTVLTQLIAQLGVDATSVFLFNTSSQTLEYAVGRGFRTKLSEHVQIRLGEGYAGQAALKREIVHIPNLAGPDDHSPLMKVLTKDAFVSYYAVPLMAKGQLKGVLEIFHRALLEPDAEWLDFLNTLAGQCAIAIDNATLFDGMQRSNTELSRAYDATIEGWSRALDLRDKETEGHTQRVTEITIRLARTFNLGKAELVQVRWGALLHDIGKMGVPDAILLKPGPLTEEEWVVMKKHPVFAYEMLAPIQYLRSALDIPYCHHEKWDGTGYPRGLKGEQIPLTARIFAIVDVWDALRSDRPYRASWTKEKVRRHIKSLAGTHFDPRVVKVFLESDIFASRRLK